MNKIDYNNKVIQVKNLKQYFTSGVGSRKIVVKAVDGISFDIHKREVFGLVGESGCGKTTTGRTIIKLYNPTDGTVTFNGRVVGAGYKTQIDNIKQAKRETKLEIIKLTPLKNALYEEKSQYLASKQAHKNVLESYKNDYDKAKKENKQQKIDYKATLQTLKEEYIVDIGEIKREKYSQTQSVLVRGIVPVVKRYNLEKKLAIRRAKDKTKYIKSSVMEQIDKDDQIRDIERTRVSELTTIEENTLVRLRKLIPNCDDYINAFGEVQYNKIVADFGPEEKQTKKEKVKEIDLKYKEDLAKVKEEYKVNLEKAKVKNYDEEAIKESAVTLKQDYQAKVLKEKENFKAIKETYKTKVAEIKLEYKDKEVSAKNQDKIAELKENLKVYIAEQKEEVRELKRLNKFRETSEERNVRLEKLELEKAEFNNKKVELENKINSSENSKEIDKFKKELKELTKIHQENINEIQKTKPTRSNLMSPMQMIFQDPISSLNPRMVVSEIISEGLKISGVKDKEVIKNKVYEILNLVGLNREHATRYPHEFSGGQRQRIGVARALITNPDFIIADEPISALDVSIQAQVINLLNDLKDELDLTILFIAHDLSVVKYFCDRIAVMYYGKIVELASSDELFLNPLHPYTKSLLSAIPQPDPHFERERKRVLYNPFMHDYSVDKPSLREIKKGHFILANDKEFKEYKKVLK